MHIPQSKIPTRVNSLARPRSPGGLFCGSRPSATSQAYSNGLTGEEESEEEAGWRCLD